MEDAFKRLESEPRVAFDLVLEPKTTVESVHTYSFPRSGDLVTGLDVRGRCVTDARLDIMGQTVYSAAGAGAVPLRINLLKLGYHTAEVHVTGEDVTVTATYELIASLEERRRIATSSALYSIGCNVDEAAGRM